MCFLRTALYFFESDESELEACTERALALEALDVDLSHSAAQCPDLPQKRQRLFCRRRFRSSVVSLLSLPNLLAYLGGGFKDLSEAELLLLLERAELCEFEFEELLLPFEEFFEEDFFLS